MPSSKFACSRRQFLASQATALAAGALAATRTSARPARGADPAGTSNATPPAAAPAVKRIAAVNTVYRIRSHAYHIAGRFIFGYDREGFHHQPPFKLVRMYNDQFPDGDLSRDLAAEHGFEIAPTVAAALGGPDQFDVDGVLLIGEHGDYPTNSRGQILYPRYDLMRQIVDVFRRAGRSVPVFNDKHLSYDYEKAAEMVGWSRELGFGFMAGSSLPVTWRRPELEPPLETPFTEGLACYGGSVEPYLFHGLETLQCMLERRRGGETGVRSVTCLRGPAVWQAEDAGRWSKKLLTAALSRSPSRNYGNVRDNAIDPVAILIEYRDGTRGTVLNLPEHISDFNFAAAIAGRDEPVSCAFELPAPPGANYFDALAWNIEKLFTTGKSPYPIERTLLTTTVLDLAMRSLADRSRPRSETALDIHYQPPADSGFFRGRYTQAG
ncbi:MAG: hypothetical protein AB7U73_15195 [Pirellulales bacterium]